MSKVKEQNNDAMMAVIQDVAVTAVGVVAGVMVSYQLQKAMKPKDGKEEGFVQKTVPGVIVAAAGGYGATQSENKLVQKFALGFAGGGALSIVANNVKAEDAQKVGLKLGELPARQTYTSPEDEVEYEFEAETGLDGFEDDYYDGDGASDDIFSLPMNTESLSGVVEMQSLAVA